MNARDQRAASRRVVTIEQTVIERYYVTDEALATIATGLRPDERDDALIALFALHAGSAFAERLFSNDANPRVWCDVKEEDEDD